MVWNTHIAVAGGNGQKSSGNRIKKTVLPRALVQSAREHSVGVVSRDLSVIFYPIIGKYGNDHTP